VSALDGHSRTPAHPALALPADGAWGMLSGLARRFFSYSGAVAAALVSQACGADNPATAAGELGSGQQAFVNGSDDRREYFELDDAAQRAALEQSGVALMTSGAASAITEGRLDVIPSWARVNSLCADEPFADQPSAAFCSGVLLDWDLVLTSGHCVDIVPVEQLRIAFGYYYDSAGELAMTEGDTYAVERVVATRRDPGVPGDEAERLDYAWVQLAEPVRPPHRPAAAYTTERAVSEGDPVISIGAGGGVPLKWDDGGRVRYSRPDFDDYFIADTDTSQGSSGGGVFDSDLTVIGSLARGAPDFSFTGAGCFTTNVESDPAQALEQFTYVHRAVEGLCAAGADSALCDSSCGEPCDAGAFEPDGAGRQGRDDGGCALAIAAAPSSRAGARGLLMALIAAALLRRRQRG
jgi:trypsin-like peptidase